MKAQTFLDIENGLASKLKAAWHKQAKEIFGQVVEAVKRRDYPRAVHIANNIDLSRLIHDNHNAMRMTAYAGMLFGAKQITERANSTAIAKNDHSNVVTDVVNQMETIIRLSAEDQVRGKLLSFIYNADMADPRTPFSNLSKREWVQKYSPDQPREVVNKFDPEQPRAPAGTEGGGQWVSAVSGPASALAREKGNLNAITEEEIMSHLSPREFDTYSRTLNNIKQEIKDGKETFKLYSKNGDGTGGYTDARKAVHDKIINDYLRNAQGKKGDPPIVTILGGRGGSGKTAFDKAKNATVGVYNKSDVVLLDCDEVKTALAVADGHKAVADRAAIYHKESDQVAISIMKQARSMGLNVVIDGTLKSRGKENILKTFLRRGYRAEGYYMFLPRAKAAERAIRRYQDGGRLVPPKIILANKANERNFDRMVPNLDKWAVYNNDVPKGQDPILVAHGEKGVKYGRARV